MKNGVFWVVTPCGSCKIRHFGGTDLLHYQCEKYRDTFLRNISPYKSHTALNPRRRHSLFVDG
jgi:hypothetical protein